MKELFCRFVSSRSFARLLSILAFAALGLALAHEAFAVAALQCRNNTTGAVTCRCSCLSGETSIGTCSLPYCSGTSSGTWGGTWNSTIECTAVSGTNSLGPTTVKQSATVQCTVDDGTTQTSGTCELNISYYRPDGLTTSGVTQCKNNGDNTSTLTDVAYCGSASRGLVVSGTLNCNPQNATSPPPICKGNNPCIANLDGITSVPNGQCSDVFSATTDLAAGQVLQASVITTGSQCSGQIVQLGDIDTRFCNSGSFDPSVRSKCKFGSEKASITGSTTAFLPVKVDVSPQTINTKCDPNKDQGNVHFLIFGDKSLDVTKIDQASLTLEGVPVSRCDAPTDVNFDGFLDLRCTVPSCPSLAQSLTDNTRNPDGTVNVVVTGSLYPAVGSSSGTAIRGEDTVGTSP